MLPGAWLVPTQQADTDKKNQKYAPLERQETQAEHKKMKKRTYVSQKQRQELPLSATKIYDDGAGPWFEPAVRYYVKKEKW